MSGWEYLIARFRSSGGWSAGGESETWHVSEGSMKENQLPEVKAESLNLEVEEIEKRERGRPNCTSSTTSDFCTCLCRIPY